MKKSFFLFLSLLLCIPAAASANTQNSDSSSDTAIECPASGEEMIPAAEFTGGDRSEENPYLVETAEQFLKIGDYRKASFKQIDDISFDMKNISHVFSDIDFSGTYDGDGHSLSGFFTVSNGLFGNISETGTVKNLEIYDAILRNMDGSLNHSFLAHMNQGSIENCTLKINAAYEMAPDECADFGAIALENLGTIEDCSVSGSMFCRTSAEEPCDSPTDQVMLGGIAARNYGIIRNCSGSLSITANEMQSSTFLGGLAGQNSGIINQSSFNGTLSYTAGSGFHSESAIGTIAGENTGTAEDCVACESDYEKIGTGNPVVWTDGELESIAENTVIF